MSRRSASQNPKAAPFKVGTRVQYVGDRKIGVGTDPAHVTWVLFPGAVGTIVKVNAGRRGTGQPLYDADGPMEWEDTGEPILDDTRDGYSVWVSDHDPRPRSANNGRCIDPEPDTLAEWKVIA